MAWLHAKMNDQEKSLVSMIGVLFVDSMRLGYGGSQTSPGHGSMVPPTVTLAIMPTVRSTKGPWCTFNKVQAKSSRNEPLTTASLLTVFAIISMDADVRGPVKKKFDLSFVLCKRTLFPS